MNREILFKAKRKDNGEWVEGSCVNISYMHSYIFTGKLDISNGYLDFSKYSVDPETICQYTGLTDKNGRKIWENDIVTISAYSYSEPEDDYTGIVFYSEHFACWCLKDINHDSMELPICDCFGSYTTEIHYIGSIFDNADLLEVE